MCPVTGWNTTVPRPRDIFSGSKVIAEYDNGAAPGSPSREYIYSGGPEGSGLLAKIDSFGTRYYHQDHLSNRVVTDSSGNTLYELGHFPYGESWYNASGDKLQFTTYESDAESGNHYARAREYINRLARFSSLDPLAGDISDPQSLNRYLYALDNPINFVDPSGLSWCAWDDGTHDDPPPDGATEKECGEEGGTWITTVFSSVTVVGDETVRESVAMDRCFIYYVDGVYAGTSCAGADLGGGGPQSTGSPQKPQQQPKKPCTPLANNLQGTPAAGVDTLVDAFSRVTHPLDMLAVNATFFISGAVTVGAGGAAIAGGCLEPTPGEPLTCGAAILGGGPTIAGGSFLLKQGVSFFKNYTLPAIKDWGCHE